jgi:hypothetical protein
MLSMLFTRELYMHILLGKNYIVYMSLRRCYVAHFAHFSHFAESLNLTGHVKGSSPVKHTFLFPDPKPTKKAHMNPVQDSGRNLTFYYSILHFTNIQSILITK